MNVPELPVGWTLVPLGDLLDELRNGISLPPTESGGLPILRISAVRPGMVNLDDHRWISDSDDWDRYRLRNGDLLFTRYSGTPSFVGVCGQVRGLDGPMVYPDKLMRARVRAGVLPGFVEKAVNAGASRRAIDLLLKTSAGQVGISGKSLKEVPVPLAPLNEQYRIVAKVDALTEHSRRAKEALDAIPPLLERFRQSVLAAAFRGDLTADWRAKNPDVEPADKLLERIRAERRRRWEEDYLAGQRAKGKEPTNDKWKAKYVEPEPVDTEGLPELPASWSWARLEELTPPEAPVVYGIVQPGPHVPGGVPYVRPADITEGRVDPHALLRTSAAIAGKHGRATLGVGDLVYSIVGTIGKHLIVDASLEGANITQSAVRIRPMAPLSAPQILWTLGCAPVQAQMKRLAFGNAVQRLNVAHMRELVVPVLPAAEWTVLEPLIEAADKCVAMQRGATVRSAEQLALLERAILAKAFRGALVPQDPNDDVQGIAEGTTRRARRRAP